MSDWHLDWQERLPIECREVYLKNSAGIAHRADAVLNKYVFEFQNSKMSPDEFYKRNSFYNDLGYKVIWIFNLIADYSHGSGNIDCYDEWSNENDNGGKFSWKYAWKTFSYYSPQRHKRIILFFQMHDGSDDEEDCYMERVIWARPGGSCSDFSRFFTSYLISNYQELMSWVSEQRL